MALDWLRRHQRVLLTLLVAAIAFAILRPNEVDVRFGVPDSIEHLAIANAWVHGQGFVDPIQYFFFLDAKPPLPGMAVRSPGVPALLAIPIAAGLDVAATNALHAIYSACVFVFVFAVIQRFMRPVAAAIATLLLLLDPGWILDALQPLTEVTALAVLMAILLVAGRLDRPAGALAGVALCVVGWLVRPNLAVAVPVLCIAWLWKLGPRRFLRTPPLLGFTLGFVIVYVAVSQTVEALTGFAPYAGYGVLSQSLSNDDFAIYGRTFPGAGAFFREHAGTILAAYGRRVIGLWDATFIGPLHLHLGFLAPVAAIHAIVRRREIPVERLVLAGLCAAFALVVIGNHVVLTPLRYPLFFVSFAAIAGVGALDDWRIHPRANDLHPKLRSIVAVVVLAALVSWLGIRLVRTHIETTRILATLSEAQRRPAPPLFIQRACERIDPDVLVATHVPWLLHTWCGNATVRIPSNLFEDDVLDRFLQEYAPAYIQLGRAGLEARADLELVDSTGGVHLYRVLAPEPPAVWHAPPALACLGEDAPCTRVDGRLRLAARADGEDRMP